MKKRIGLILGPTLALALLLFFDLEPGAPNVTRCAAVAALMAVWWITEAIPIPATALLPMALFPLLGVMNGATVAHEYFNSIIFLFVGGFILALAMQRWDLHRRIALLTILFVGSGARRIIFGFMLATFVMSMWVSNTATTMMMVPMALAVITQLRSGADESRITTIDKFAVALLIGIAYAASIGGLATLIGTPPNLVFARQVTILFPELPEISFAQWMIFALPFALIFLGICWLLLTKLFLGKRKLGVGVELFRKEYSQLGPMRYQEWVVMISFSLMALLWIFRKSITVGEFRIPGWTEILPVPWFVDDGVIAITVALLLFVIPARDKHKPRIMNWETAKRLNWGIVLLFGGGFALAAGFVESGLTQWLSHNLSGFAGAPSGLIVGSISAGMTFLTELTSNTASTQMLLPALGAFAESNSIHPLLILIPATLSASCAFMLPVATPPNAIVFGSGEIKMSQMIRAGLIMNLIGIVLITLWMFIVGVWTFGI
jgi:sodium-dependent dicarboxylate transporter 2/3/5